MYGKPLPGNIHNQPHKNIKIKSEIAKNVRKTVCRVIFEYLKVKI